jgi:hypothetical protein
VTGDDGGGVIIIIIITIIIITIIITVVVRAGFEQYCLEVAGAPKPIGRRIVVNCFA